MWVVLALVCLMAGPIAGDIVTPCDGVPQVIRPHLIRLLCTRAHVPKESCARSQVLMAIILNVQNQTAYVKPHAREQFCF